MGRFLRGKKIGSRIIPGVTGVLTFTTITYPAPNESTVNQNVWMYDGNIEYLHGKHIPLFIVSVGFGVFALFFESKNKKKEK